MADTTWIVVAVLGVFAVCCFRKAAWHRNEAGFWREIALLDRLGMAPSDAPDLLRWAQANRPGWLGTLRGWRSPHVRRRRALEGSSRG